MREGRYCSLLSAWAHGRVLSVTPSLLAWRLAWENTQVRSGLGGWMSAWPQERTQLPWSGQTRLTSDLYCSRSQTAWWMGNAPSRCLTPVYFTFYLSLTLLFLPPLILLPSTFHHPSFLLQDPVVQFCLATRCGGIWFDLRGCVAGAVNHFYCSLTHTSFRATRETLFQQMNKTHITINLFIEKETSLMLCFTVRRVRTYSICVCGLRCFAGFVCSVCRICVHMCRRVHVGVCAMEQMAFRPLCAIEKSPYVFPGLTSVNTQCCTERKIQIWQEMQRTVSTDHQQIYLQWSTALTALSHSPL